MLIKREMAGNAMRIRLASYPENFQGNVALITTLPSLLPLRVQMEPQTVTRSAADIWRERLMMDGSMIIDSSSPVCRLESDHRVQGV